MILTKKKFLFVILFFATAGISKTIAQDLNISGDTIFVNAEAEIMVRFPTLPSFFNTIPSNAPYNFKTIGTGFTIIAKTEKTSPAPLFVTEGGRNHKFLIVFKKNIDYNNDAEMDYDYSTTKKLEQHIRDLASAKIQETKKPEPVSKDDSKSKKSKKSKPEESNSAGYYALLEEGDINIKEKDYKAAKINFEKAASLRPNDQIPKQRLEEVRLRMADQEKTVEQELNKKYVAIIAAAKSDFNAKKYANAQQGYKKALELKPGDIYAKHQLEKIDELISKDNDKKEQQRLDKLYRDYISAGEKALKKNDLTEARVAYEQAAIIKQNDAVALAKLKTIDEKEKLEKEKAEQELNYSNTIESADKLFKAGYYAEAKVEYNRAAGFSKKTYPQEQIKNIDKLQAAQLAKENADKQKNIKDSESAKKNKEKTKQEADYNEAVKAADKYFAAKDYTNATIAYNRALSIDKRTWPADQLKTIQKLKDQEEADRKKLASQQESDKQAKERKKQEEKENQAREKEYKALVKEADRLFKKNDYEAAKASYVKASSLSNEKKPFEQILAIDKILEEQRAKENAEKAKLAKEAEINTQYTSIIDKANSEFDKANYLKARKLYSDAAQVKPSEKLPGEKLNQIQLRLDEIAASEKAKKDSIAAAAELKKKYVLLMSKAKSYFLKEDYTNAKNAYTEASQLKPSEDEPRIQINAIQAKLDAIARANEIDDKYEQKIATADSLMILKSYENAITAYREALGIKPNQYYPLTQINYVTAEIRNQQKEKEDRAKLEAYKREEELDIKFRDALKRADAAVKEKKYDVAKAAYTEVLAIRPDHDYSKQRLEIVTYQLEKESIAKNKKADEQKAESNKPVADKKGKDIATSEKTKTNIAAIPVTPVPYSDAELKAKYPNIDFSKLPPEQPFNEGAINTLENTNIFKDVLTEAPRLDLSTSDNKVKLTCQGINFEGTSVYLKFLIQNNGKTDFLTGAMMVTWTKRSGSKIKLYPVYLFPAFLPIVTPGNEATVIYVCKSYYINDSEKLSFEMSDRLNKIKLEIDIPGKKYNEEEAR